MKRTGVKIMLAVGGWYDSADDKYSRMVSSRSSRLHFVKHAVKFLKEHDFDGMEIEWMYPKCWQVNHYLQFTVTNTMLPTLLRRPTLGICNTYA